MKKTHVQIVDARKAGKLCAFRVKSVASNGEILQVSEVLESKKAVQTHLKAMAKCWNGEVPCIVDKTAKKVFTTKIKQ